MIGEPSIDYRLEHVFSYCGSLAKTPVTTVLLADGVGVDFSHSTGELAGPRLRGVLRPAGADWTVIGVNGVGKLDVRRTLEAHDGTSLLVIYQGLIDVGHEGARTLYQGALPPAAQLRFALRFVGDHPEYQWLERLQCFGIGEYRATENVVRYDVYAVHHGRRSSASSRRTLGFLG